MLTVLLTVFGNAPAQSISSSEIDRGNSMLRAIKSNIEENYYDPKFRGLDIEALFKQAGERINKADQQTKRVTDLTDYDEVARLEIQEQRDARLLRHRFVEMDDVFIWKMPQFDLTKAAVDEVVGKFRKRKALILDLRGNSGGYEETQLRLLGSLFENDVKVGDLIARKPTKPLIAKSIGNDAFKGQVIVLIDCNSASSAELLARVVS